MCCRNLNVIWLIQHTMIMMHLIQCFFNEINTFSLKFVIILIVCVSVRFFEKKNQKYTIIVSYLSNYLLY